MEEQKHVAASNSRQDIILGGGFKCFFIVTRGEMIQFDVHIFQMGWFNHHLVAVSFLWSNFQPQLCNDQNDQKAMKIEIRIKNPVVFFQAPKPTKTYSNLPPQGNMNKISVFHPSLRLV